MIKKLFLSIVLVAHSIPLHSMRIELKNLSSEDEKNSDQIPLLQEGSWLQVLVEMVFPQTRSLESASNIPLHSVTLPAEMWEQVFLKVYDVKEPWKFVNQLPRF